MRKPAGLTLAASTAACLVLVTGCSGTGPTGEPTSSSGATVTSQTSPAPSSTEAPASGSANASETTGGDRDILESPPANDWTQALEAARKEFPGDPIKIELESRPGGGLEYKLELVTDAAEYEVQFDAETLEKLSDDEDQAGDDVAKDRLKIIDTNDIVTLDDAVKTARGKQEGTITSWKLEGKDDGSVKYEFDIVPKGGSQDIEVSINAKDGSVIAGS